MPTRVFGDLVAPNGEVVRNARVEFRLTGAPRAWDDLDQLVVSRVQTTTDGNGHYEIDLISNAVLTPAGTVWRRQVQPIAPSLWSSFHDDVIVPEFGGPYNERDILQDEPGSVSGTAAPVSSLAETLTLESLGAVADQTAAGTLEARWLAFIRDAGSGSPSHPTFNYLGGDVTDVLVDGASALWVGADWYDGTTVDADDTYAGDALPVRNGSVLESAIGTFSQQNYHSGSSGVWLNAVASGGLPAGTHWWPIAVLNDAGTRRVLCWHVDPAVGPWGGLLDSHIVTLNAFLGYASHVVLGLGALTDRFWLDDAVRDTTHTYVFGQQFIPDYDADMDADGSVPNYGIGADLSGHHTIKRVARVANGSLLTIGAWEYWNGSGWVSDVTAATPLLDADGAVVPGDAGVDKIADGHWLLAAHQLVDSHVAVYKGPAPQGPWTRIARVPVPTQGALIQGGRQIGQLTKIIPTAMHPAGTPAEHRIALLSRNLLFPTAAFADRNIRRYAPQFAVIPIH